MTADRQRLYSVHQRLDPVTLNDVEAMVAVRLALLTQIQRYTDRCGYVRATTREEVTVDGMTLTALLIERTDGDWAAVHQAVREDEEERRALRRPDLRGEPF